MFEQTKNRRADPHRLPGGLRVDARNFARGPVKAQPRFEAVHFCQRLLPGGAQPPGVLANDDHFESRGHRVARKGDRFHYATNRGSCAGPSWCLRSNSMKRVIPRRSSAPR